MRCVILSLGAHHVTHCFILTAPTIFVNPAKSNPNIFHFPFLVWCIQSEAAMEAALNPDWSAEGCSGPDILRSDQIQNPSITKM